MAKERQDVQRALFPPCEAKAAARAREETAKLSRAKVPMAREANAEREKAPENPGLFPVQCGPQRRLQRDGDRFGFGVVVEDLLARPRPVGHQIAVPIGERMRSSMICSESGAAGCLVISQFIPYG